MNSVAPALRFKNDQGNEFDEWEDTTLGDLTKWSSGGTPAKDNPSFWEGDIPWMSAASMHECYYFDSPLRVTEAGVKSGSKIALEGTLLLLVRGSMLWNRIPVGIAMRDVAFNQDVKALTPTNRVIGEFLLQWFMASENMLLHKVVGTGIGAGKLDTDETKRLPVSLPSLPEQRKIVDFLTAVDERIGHLIRKKALLGDYKKGVMQQLFTQAIRFKDDQGNDFPGWEEKNLKEIASPVKNKNRNMAVDLVLTNSATRGIVSQRDYFDKDIANAKNIGGYYVVSRNDFVYNPRISESAPVGPIKRNHLSIGVMSPLYTVFRFEKGEATFFEFYFQTNMWHEYMNSVANFGARHDRMAITTSDFYCLPLPFPSIAEQTKIADFLSAIDRKIESVATQITETQTFKRGLLQQMFV